MPEPVAPARPVEAFDLDGAWQLHEQVSIRPERFGALLYHFGTRRLSFLKTPLLLEVVRGLAASGTARATPASPRVWSRPQLPPYRDGADHPRASQMIRRREPPS